MPKKLDAQLKSILGAKGSEKNESSMIKQMGP
jgi:hypothetical protein